eukprot:CAMPEP_0170072152 /NCGR_PEP_ID=MMETSP0019_2-20121128/9862_1 /TAXON_ID=98059 /ORGANISM="Dinobryon sp., Strain UTEXLB2267" /LENGTH=110 /DNA_ID=CAMNT_0010280981 /DNA_START=779 /DNA_END=1111 /DNA_ORIENTATION=+
MEAEQHRQTRDRQPVFTLLIDNVSVRFKSLLDCEGFDEKVPIDSERWVLLSDKTEKLVENIVRAPLLLLVDSLAGQYYDLVRLHEDDSGGLVVRVSVKPHNRTIPPDPVG